MNCVSIIVAAAGKFRTPSWLRCQSASWFIATSRAGQ